MLNQHSPFEDSSKGLLIAGRRFPHADRALQKYFGSHGLSEAMFL